MARCHLLIVCGSRSSDRQQAAYSAAFHNAFSPGRLTLLKARRWL